MHTVERRSGRTPRRIHRTDVGGVMQKRCAYCRKALEEGKVVKMTILIIHGTQLVPRERTYCSKRCGEYDAMANEA
ncbi:YdaE family protein [Klebsiella michiganensis]|uniref:YdaE family protein n=1 Tax=Klebsiella michiganensis TaxID=1134687 RepID=UPI003F60A385